VFCVSADCKGVRGEEVDSRQFKVERKRKKAKGRDAEYMERRMRELDAA